MLLAICWMFLKKALKLFVTNHAPKIHQSSPQMKHRSKKLSGKRRFTVNMNWKRKHKNLPYISITDLLIAFLGASGILWMRLNDEYFQRMCTNVLFINNFAFVCCPWVLHWLFPLFFASFTASLIGWLIVIDWVMSLYLMWKTDTINI